MGCAKRTPDTSIQAAGLAISPLRGVSGLRAGRARKPIAGGRRKPQLSEGQGKDWFLSFSF